MLPHLAPSCSKCSAVVYAARAALERLPTLLSPAAARRKALTVILGACITASQSIWMPRHAVPGPTRLSGLPIAARTAPQGIPRPVGPHAEDPQSEPVCLSSQAPGSSRVVTAGGLCIGRNPAVSIGPAGSRPCPPPRTLCPVCPSRIPAGCPRPAHAPPPAAPRASFRAMTQRLRRRPCPKTGVP